jgi:monomeric sarcosine oxidase
VVVPGVLHSARAHGLDVEPLDAEACAERFPGLRLPAGAVAVWERAAGYLLVEECVAACLRLARRLGAEVVLGAAVRRWHVAGRMVVVESDAGPFAADRLVVAAGPWAGELLAELKLPLSVLRKTLVWFASRDDRYQAQRGGPAFLYETPAGYFYGFPQLDPRGVKLAEHSGGEPVADPLAVDRSLRPADVAPVADFARRYLPGLTLQVTDHTVCLYTMTPDGHFVVDRHPQHDQVVLAAGLSGHGFKFASVLGELLSELSLDGQTRLPIGFLAAGRPSLQADA